MVEHSYQEMTSFPTLNAHLNPSRVLIIGGDGGLALECLKHSAIEKLVQCEIDDYVAELLKKYFPSMAKFYDDPKLGLAVGDACKHLADLPDGSFHVIITDSSDPKSPAVCLFQQPNYELLEEKLALKGIICCQGESIWIDLDFIASLTEINRKIFKMGQDQNTYNCAS